MSLDKVTAFITRDLPTGRELLVFQHPTAGIQLPAGTVELGESAEAALFREVSEETGLTAVEVVRHLCTVIQPLEPEERLLTKDTVLQSSPGDEGTLHRAIILKRGAGVRVIGSEDLYDRVVFPEYQTRDGEVVQVSARTGWIPRKHLTNDVARHMYHLRTNAPTPHHWTQSADDHLFSLFWVSLREDPGLIPNQDEWYKLVREQLRN